MRTIADIWSSFEARVLPPSVGPVQRQEMRRAFYGGAVSALGLCVEISDHAKTDDQGATMFEALHQECRDFGRAVEEGRA